MSLNTTKISGACGKLMCCIAYESELYQKSKGNAADQFLGQNTDM